MTSEETLAVLTENECLGLLRSHDLGRIAFEFAGRIEIFPVNYSIEGRVIVFRTSPGTKLSGIGKGSVALEVDGWDRATGIGWSVVAKGLAADITTDSGRAAEHLRWVPVRPAAPGDRCHWIGVKPTEITGRRFHASVPQGGPT